MTGPDFGHFGIFPRHKKKNLRFSSYVWENPKMAKIRSLLIIFNFGVKNFFKNFGRRKNDEAGHGVRLNGKPFSVGWIQVLKNLEKLGFLGPTFWG